MSLNKNQTEVLLTKNNSHQQFNVFKKKTQITSSYKDQKNICYLYLAQCNIKHY